MRASSCIGISTENDPLKMYLLQTPLAPWCLSWLVRCPFLSLQYEVGTRSSGVSFKVIQDRRMSALVHMSQNFFATKNKNAEDDSQILIKEHQAMKQCFVKGNMKVTTLFIAIHYFKRSWEQCCIFCCCSCCCHLSAAILITVYQMLCITLELIKCASPAERLSH